MTASTNTAPAPLRLEGQELLDFLAANAGTLSVDEAAKATGYVTVKADGSKQLNRTAYYKAIGEANGVVHAKAEREGARTRSPKGVLVVGPNGGVPLGKAYIRLLGLVTGDYVSVYEDEEVLIIDPNTDEAKEAKAKAASMPAKEPALTLVPDAEFAKIKEKAKAEKVAA